MGDPGHEDSVVEVIEQKGGRRFFGEVVLAGYEGHRVRTRLSRVANVTRGDGCFKEPKTQELGSRCDPKSVGDDGDEAEEEHSADDCQVSDRATCWL